MDDSLPTPERIRLAALTIFTEAGYEGASMSQIAKAVGIKTPSIYAHFQSKEQLFLQLTQQVIEEEWEQYLLLLERHRDEQAERQLHYMFDFFTDFDNLSSGQAFLKRTMVVPPPHLRERLRLDFLKYERKLTDKLAVIIRKGKSEGVLQDRDEEMMIAQLYASMDALLVEYQIYDRELFERRKSLLWQSLWQLWT